MKLLLALDGSEASMRAVDYVARLAKDGVAVEPHLLTVYFEPLSYGDVSVQIPNEQVEALRRGFAEPVLAQAQERLAEAGVKSERELAAGEIPRTIVQRAEDLGCDGIVMGTHGAGAAESLFFGSVAQRVVRQSKVPVTLVR